MYQEPWMCQERREEVQKRQSLHVGDAPGQVAEPHQATTSGQVAEPY